MKPAVLVIFLLTLTLAVAAQQQPAPAPAAPQHQVIARASVHPDSGTMIGDTFYSDFFRFAFTVPHGWTIEDRAGIRKGTEEGHAAMHASDPPAEQAEVEKEHQEAEDRTFILLSAEGKLDQQPGLSQVLIGAEELPADIKTAADYMKYAETDPMLAELQLTPVHPAEAVPLAGRPFMREAYTAQTTVEQKSVSIAYSEYVTVQDGYALVFSFWSDTPEHLAALEKHAQTLRFGAVPSPPSPK